jgi:uncharacterized membrane-anchored protein YhcB (DUF1043 family)
MAESTNQMAQATTKMQQHMGTMAQAILPLLSAEDKLEEDLHPEKRIKKKLDSLSGRLDKLKMEVEKTLGRSAGPK